MLTIAFRSLPGNAEWQYKTVVTRRPPERWLAERLETVELGEAARLEACVLYAREITEEDAARLEEALDRG